MISSHVKMASFSSDMRPYLRKEYVLLRRVVAHMQLYVKTYQQILKLVKTSHNNSILKSYLWNREEVRLKAGCRRNLMNECR